MRFIGRHRPRGHTTIRRGAVGLFVALLVLPVVATTASADPLINPPSLPCVIPFGTPQWDPSENIAHDDSYTRENGVALGQTVGSEWSGPKSDAGDDTFLSVNVAAPGVLENDEVIVIDHHYNLPAEAQAALYTGPAHAASFTLNADGSFHYVPQPGYYGADSFTYVWYTSGSYCSTGGTVTIAAATHVRARDDSYTAYVNTTLVDELPICSFVGVCGVLDNDLGANGNTRVGRIFYDSGGNTFYGDPGVPRPTQHGTYTLLSNGTFTYTPNADYQGPDYFWYVPVDSVTGEFGLSPHCHFNTLQQPCDPGQMYAVVNINVTTPPLPTVAQGVDDAVTVNEDTTTTIPSGTLLANDIHATNIIYVQNAFFPYPSLRTDHGTVTMHYADLISGFPSAYVASIDYTPDPNYNGPDSFRYYPSTGYNNGWDISDDTGTVVLTVAPVADPPKANTDSGTTGFDRPITVNVTANDTDPEGDLDPTSVGHDPNPCGNEPQHIPSCDVGDTSGWEALAHGTWQPNGDGTITYTPTPGFVGTAIWPYQVCDVGDRCDQATVAVTVKSVADDTYDASEDTLLTVTAPGVLANDKPGVSATVGTTTTHGTLSLQANGSFTYSPAADFNGTDTFTYTIGTADTATVTINVAAVNDPPNLYLNGFCDHSIPLNICLFDTDVRDIDEGGTAELNGSITDAEFEGGTLTIEWGDGTSTTADYPCDGADCPFTLTRTYPSLCIGSCGDPIYFHLTHTYTDDPSGASDYYTISGSAVEADDTTGTAGASARVVNVPPDLTVSPEGCALCIGSYSHLTVATGEQASIAGQITDPGIEDGSLTIDWGDGSPDSIVGIRCGTGTDVCPTPSQQGLGCGLPGSTSMSCGYFDVPHVYTTGGQHTIQLTATDGDGGSDSAEATASVTGPDIDTAPAITSADSTTFTVGTAGSFTVTTTGTPTAALSESGTLPSGVTFTDNADGTATLSGTPAAGTGGDYPLTISATNGVDPDAGQSFTLHVHVAPAITSASTTTFTVGSVGSFTVTTTGTPTASITMSGGLPSGLTFTDNGDGTATLSGTPAAGTAGDHPISFTASNGVAPDAHQSFTLHVNVAPAITSADHTTFTVGSAGTFTVTTTGTPTPSLSKVGVLPGGITFTDQGDGTAILSGTPASGTGGDYALTVTASNGVAPDAHQSFTLHVASPPAITSADHTTFTVGSAGTFTVTTTGAPAPALSESGSLPAGVTFVDNGNGTATLSGTPAAGSSGPYTLTISAANGVAPDAGQSFSLTVDSKVQSISFDPLGGKTYGDAAITVSATATSGLAVDFTASPAGVCTSGGSHGVTITIVGVGTCTVTAHQAGNGTWQAAPDVARMFNVGAKSVTVHVTPASVQYSDPVPNLDIVGSVPGLVGSDALSGTLSGCTASGLTVSGGMVQSPAGNYPLTGCAGLSNPNYTVSYSGSLAVAKEAATAAYGGPTYASTGSASATKATVALTGQITQDADGHPGDLTKATAQFLLYNSGNSSMATPDLTVTGTVSAAGVVSGTAANLPVDTYTVILRILPGNGFFGGPEADADFLTVFTPATDTYLSGGGWVLDPSFQNKPVAVDAKHPKGHLGFNVSYAKKNSTTPKGHAAYTFHGADGYVYLIKSTSWQGGALALNGAHAAYFAGKSTVVAIDPLTGLPVPGIGGGNFSFRVDIVDGGSGGANDTYALSVWTPSGALYHQVGTAASPLTLQKGELTVAR
ncbi:MAG TPA: Ig-like domain-containing protein [Candidatus Limnocylindrales bacterium]|nr:Ig-like domain-containing protein [Candidatus Limnocylindrales bacterium]